MIITLPITPPKGTSQMKGARIIIPKDPFRKPFIHFFKKKALIAHENELLWLLKPFRLARPIDGPVELRMDFVWPYRKSEKKAITRLMNYIFHITRPDVGNYAKLLEDCLTKSGFFHDDNQVCDLRLRKFWGPTPYVRIVVKEAVMPTDMMSSKEFLLPTYNPPKNAGIDAAF